MIEAGLQLELINETARSFEYTLKVINERYLAGTAPPLDLRLARANAATAQATVSLRERRRDSALRSLEIVLGRYPSAELGLAGSLPVVNTGLPIGMPLQLLERRPDIIAAFRQVQTS